MRRALLFLLCAAPALAGDRPLGVLFVNMTPDAASSDASKKCVKAIEKKLAANDTEVRRLGETVLRKRASQKTEAFLDWPLDALKAAKHDEADALVLVDCRPENSRLDVVVHPASAGVVRLQLRDLKLDTDLVAEAILRRAWAGFSP